MVFTTLGLLIVYLMYTGMNSAYQEDCVLRGVAPADCSLKDKLIEDFKSVKLSWIVLTLVIFMISNVFRALRWNQMLVSLDLKPRFINSLGAIMIGYFANLGVPRIGEFVKVGIISKYDDMPPEKVMGTIVIDRLMDVIFFALFILLGFLVSFQLFSDYFQDNFKVSTGQILTVLGALAIVGLLGLWIGYKFIFKKINETSNAFLQKLKKLVIGFTEGLQSVLLLDSPLLFLAYSIGIWICYYLMTYLCFFSFEPTALLGPKVALIVFIFGTLGMVIPTPGGLGSYHYLVTQALILHGLAEIDSFSFAMIIFFAISILGNVIFGLFFLILMPLYNKNQVNA